MMRLRAPPRCQIINKPGAPGTLPPGSTRRPGLGSAKMKVENAWEVVMAHARNVHHQTPTWLQMWNIFALTATGIGMLLLLVILAALAIYG